MSINIQSVANQTLEKMRAVGFDSAQVSVSVSERNELNMAHNEPSLLRSTEDHQLSLLGIIDGKKASSTLSDLSEDSITQGIGELLDRAKLAPQDEANAVSVGETGHFEQGPAQGDMDMLAQKIQELLEFRSENTPKMTIEEGAAVHTLVKERMLTSDGTDLSCFIGSYSLSALGTASDGEKASSFNETEGTCHDLGAAHAAELFGIGEMLIDTEKQIDTKPVGGNFIGDIILAPAAVTDLLEWLLEQLGDFALIANSSIFKESVGDMIASSLLTIRSRFDAPGSAAYTEDGFVAPPLTLVDSGKLTSLLPSLYGSKKTGLAHRPSCSGWSIDGGDTTKAELISGIGKGALVNRLSMGYPAPNGDFSGVIKNSFVIEGGAVGEALSETMISGNMASMLNDIVGISKEHLDLGGEDFPWIRIENLHFS